MDFDIEKNTLESAKELKYLLSDSSAISVESISKEFYKSAKSGKSLANFLIKLDDAGILQTILPEYTRMKEFRHNPKWHPEGDSMVLGHILECLKVSPYKDPVINLAVMLHDFGKATTRADGKDGHSSYHGHESAGVPIVQSIFDRLKFGELSAQDKKSILFAVEKHMLVHNLDKLKIKTLSKLILSPEWEVCKAVGYCDEASRGPGLFDEKIFWKKINDAEETVFKLGKSADDLRLKIKKYVDGNKLMEWFPEIKKNPKLLKPILDELNEYIINLLNRGKEPQEKHIRGIAKKYLTTIS